MPEPACTAETWATELLKLLETQRGLIAELDPLARQQGRLIQEGKTEALLTLLGRRQKIIDRFVAGQPRLTELTAELDGRLQQVGDQERQRIRTLITDIDRSLAEVMELDARDQAHLQAARDSTRSELTAVNSGQQARNAYLKPGMPGNRFADKHG